MSDESAVEFRAVTKRYGGGSAAIERMDLRIPTGRIIALLGPSGCGKTTTLRLINRLEEATEGDILIRGREIHSIAVEPLRRSVGYVIQEGGLMPHWNVATNVGTVPRLLGWPRDKVRRRVAEVLELVGLQEAEFGRRMPAQLSGGQRQRIGVARGLAADPDLLLMDEPFGALDPGTREAIQDEFLALQARLKKTIVIVTHDVAEAARLADEIVLLDRGRILQRGSLRDLLVHPADPRVGAFLGGHRHELALANIRLHQILDGLAPIIASPNVGTLKPELSLGQLLARVASLDSADTVAIDDGSGRVFQAGVLRDRVLAELRAASRE